MVLTLVSFVLFFNIHNLWTILFSLFLFFQNAKSQSKLLTLNTSGFLLKLVQIEKAHYYSQATVCMNVS